MAKIDPKISKKHYDVGIYGWWGHENFGGVLTYFALQKTLTNMGCSVLMIQEADGLPGRYKIPENSIAMNLAKSYYDFSVQVNVNDLGLFNNICDKFIIGGDQVWNPSIHFSKEDCFLNFVDDSKPKISFASSFGNKNFTKNTFYIEQMKPYLKRFDDVLVREDYAVDICKNYFGVNGTQVIDAVYLLDLSEYKNIAKKSTLQLPKKYMLCFILNPSIEKKNQIELLAKEKGLEVVCFPDADSNSRKNFYNIFSDFQCITDLNIENFLKCYDSASYVVTDSFHGTCFSYIFRKPFSVYYNAARGSDRFDSLMSTLKLDSRKINEFDKEKKFLTNDFSDAIDFSVADKNVEKLKKYSFSRLKAFLSSKPKETSKNKYTYSFSDLRESKTDPILESSVDFKNIRLVASLLHDYGVKHVVLSPGGRDVPIIRMFENNNDKFILHKVTDERSAAYFGLGLAVELQSPVVCVCTSGTAVSNFLPAVTEAYFTGVPLIVITADRYSIFHDQGEDQTIFQSGIFKDVTKMEVSLPETFSNYAYCESRRKISQCILESTHNGFGPVHINIPIDNISIGANLSKDYWGLLPFTYPHLSLVSFFDSDAKLSLWFNELKKSRKILIVFGQNYHLPESVKNDIEKFAESYNCVILTDHISNYHGSKTLQTFNLLRSISQDDFDKNLAPDIVITVGGKSLMNDPLTFKIRGSKTNIRHWDVNPFGKTRDFYFRQSTIIEGTLSKFFSYFANRGISMKNDNAYFTSWKTRVDSLNNSAIEDYNSLYIQQEFFKYIPNNCIVHLGVGQTFFDCRRFKIDKSIDVHCNMGTNGIDGCTSTFMGQCAIASKTKKCFLIVGDLSFFYDLNSIWNKQLNKNIKILLVNNNGTSLLKSHNLDSITSIHNTKAEGWVNDVGFNYLSCTSKSEFDMKIKEFVDNDDGPLFFEVFCNR